MARLRMEYTQRLSVGLTAMHTVLRTAVPLLRPMALLSMAGRTEHTGLGLIPLHIVPRTAEMLLLRPMALLPTEDLEGPGLPGPRGQGLARRQRSQQRRQGQSWG